MTIQAKHVNALQRAVSAVYLAHSDHQVALKMFVDAPVWRATECANETISTGEKLAEAVKALIEAEMMLPVAGRDDSTND